MGMDRITVELLLAEHRYRRIEGNLLAIGRQTIGMTWEGNGSQVAQLIWSGRAFSATLAA